MKKTLIQCVILLQTSLVWAALGDLDSSIAGEARNISARHSMKNFSQYQVHTLVQPTLTVTEYVSAKHVVFAVRWQGVKAPDLASLLGTHYKEYSQEISQQSKSKGRQAHTVQTQRLYVHGGGHMRDLRGLAYLPEEVPEGVKVEDLP